ncbi:hypothetical protein TBR22_A34170 [Luteitalea sp. TBR-22]|uniref:DUF5829 family protein n=1 Tax=Luteitalea sp. TBR-22 TaxID=2802971 RepID=UPI001AF06B0D|nr:DUF5829 family protein [Luteitalea sp. TBR-22]BCS34188.1 hypothetical protein TBR22_A34170 [Luteitalea sp. TBR-22]
MTLPLRLNHLFRVVDAETFAAARDSAWLREVFAPGELRTTRRPDWTYTGLYWYGISTYLELFEEGPQGPIGASGIAFAIEEPGATAAIASALRQSLGEADHRLVVRPVGDDTVPWFHIAHAVPDQRAGLKLWTMEYHADFLAGWHAAHTPARGITRAEVLERYAAVSPGPARPLLGDVVAVTMAVTPAERGFLLRHVEAFDATTRDTGGDGTMVTGDDLSIGLSAASETRRGLQDLVFRLRRPTGREVITIGRSTITVEGTRGVWKFRDV